MSTLEVRLDAFRRRLRERLAAAEGAPPAIASEASTLRTLVERPPPDTIAPPKPASQPATAFLDQALAAGVSGPEAALAEAIRALAPDLAWTYGYPFDPTRPDLGKTIAFANILGRGGFDPAPDVLVGLTLIAPRTLYPLHAHPAIELYLVIAGTARWQASGAVEINPPGALILHPSQTPHATETAAEPLLALYTWRGDLASPSVFLPR